MRVKHPRKAPGLMLAFAVALGSAGLAADRIAAWRHASGAGERIEGLQRQAAREHATASDWLALARALQADGRHAPAVEAFRNAFAHDPYLAEARLGEAISLAALGDARALFEALTDLVVRDARLALEVLGRADVARFRNQPGFNELLAEARSQAVD